jgi:nicotinamide phosphoribosyltransferase
MAKYDILARNGKLVIRPDSGGPVDIVCGTIKFNNVKEYEAYIKTNDNRTTPEKGVVESLWEIFGGEITSTGFKRLISSIGVIYGDAITLQRSADIDKYLINKGFATTNIVLGVGSYSLQVVGRDVHGFAQKCTYVEIKDKNGVINGIDVYKDPITDNGVKKSARGLIVVYKNANGVLYEKDQATWDEVNSEENQLKVILRNGVQYNKTTYTEIRERINKLI